jgi:multiple sugar transport system substrate-binding protein
MDRDGDPRRRRRLLTALLLLVCLLAAAGCAPGQSIKSESESGGPVTLQVSTWGNDSRLKLTQQAVDAFTAANPDIKVTIQNNDWSAYWDKLATMTAGNNSPDVIQMDESYIAAYGARDALLDLGKVNDSLDLSAMDAKVLDTGKVGGTLVGAPIGVANFSVGVNPEVLKKAGVSMPNDKTWTWDQLAQIAAQVTGKLESQGVYGLDGFGTGAAELGAWARQKGEEIWPTEGPGVSQATITSFFDYANKLVAMKAAPPAGRQVENSTAVLDQNMFATNKAAFHLLFHTQISAFKAASGTEMKLLRIPAQAKGESPKMVNKASMYWSVSSRTKQPEASAKLIDFLLTDPAATKVLTTERGIRRSRRCKKRSLRCWTPRPRSRSNSRSQSRRSSCRRPKSPQPTPPASAPSSLLWVPTCSSAGPAGGRRDQGALDHPEHEVVDPDRHPAAIE